MHRFYIPPEQFAEGDLRLAGAEAHHALHVLRVHPGQKAKVVDGAGHEFVCEVLDRSHEQVQLKILERRAFEPQSCSITLFQALPKGRIIESIIQKANELGAARVVPLLSERTVVRLDAAQAQQKGSKWQSIAVEAIKQCGCPWLTQVEAPVPLARALAERAKCDLELLGSLQPNSKHPRTYFREYQARTGRMPRSAALWIGPEGDFSPEELKAIESAGALPISLGPFVLRAETAAIYSLSVVNYELQAPR